jgi:hypothetical protein
MLNLSVQTTKHERDQVQVITAASIHLLPLTTDTMSDSRYAKVTLLFLMLLVTCIEELYLGHIRKRDSNRNVVQVHSLLPNQRNNSSIASD